MLIDTHAHIYAEQFEGEVDDIVQRAKDAGIGKVFLPNIDRDSIDGMHKLVEKYPDYFYAMMGLHPCSVDKNYKKELAYMENLLDKGSYIAIGEIGMDLYWDKTYKAEQEEAFVIQCGWAAQRDLPIVIHSRESIPQILDILERENIDDLRGVFHCFSGDETDIKRIEALGFYMGISGVLTFKNSGLDKVLPLISQDRIMFETDAPYLAPTPYRGKRNESSYVKLIGEKAAEILGLTVNEIAERSTENALRLFDKV